MVVDQFKDVAYGNDRWVGIYRNGTNRVAYSTDNAVTWNTTSAVEVNQWENIVFAYDRFFAFASDGTNRIMYSRDGVDWTSQRDSENGAYWRNSVYANDLYRVVAVSADATNRVSTLEYPITQYDIEVPGITGSSVWTYNETDGYYISQSYDAVTANYTYTSESFLGTYATESSSTTTQVMFPLSSEDFVANITNLYDEYKSSTRVRFRINTRDRFPRKTFVTESWTYTSDASFLPTQSYYSVRDGWDETEWIPYSTYTQISVDQSGSYFDMYMDGLEPERFYRIMLKVVQNSGSTNEIERVIDNDYMFRVVR